jgi:uncharacterized protein YjbI with pentapeptide repeats
VSVDSASTNSGHKKDRQVPAVGLIVLGVGLAAVAVLVFVFLKVQSWHDLTPGQATLLAGMGAIVAASLAVWGAWITRRGAEENTQTQIAADRENLTSQITAQSDNLSAQLHAQEIHLRTQIEAQSEQLRATHALEEARDLRTRYTAVAQQLAEKTLVIRMAGTYALASLADDWHAFGNDRERQVCIDLLCAQLRDLTATADDDRKLRAALIKVIHQHTKISDDRLPENGWSRCQFDLSSADLQGIQLPQTVLFDATLDDCNLSGALLMGVQLSHAHLRRADLRNAMLTFARLRRVDLTDAQIDDSTELTGIKYDNETTWPQNFTPPPST